MVFGRDSRFARHDLAGIYHAVVTQNDDVDGPGGRVKLRFPWLPDGDREQTRWAPIVVPMVGDRYGTYVLPDVGDGVLVMFIAGDVDHPVVVGSAWSGEGRPPESNADGKNDFRMMKSRSGNRVLLDDSPNGKVMMSDASEQHFLTCGVQQPGGAGPNACPVPAAPAVTRAAGQGVSIGAMSGSLELLCPDGKLTVSAPVIEVTGLDGVDLSAGGDLALSSPGTASLGTGGAGAIGGSVLKLGAG